MSNSAIVGMLRVLLAANTSEFDAAMKRASNSAKAWTRDLGQIGRQAQSAGMALTKTLTAPIVGLAATSVKAFANFDAAMTRSTAILTDLSDVMKSRMEAAARDVAKTTAFSASEAAEAFYFLASAGYDAEQAIGALPKVAKFAQAGDFNLAQATEYLADAQSALGMTIRDDVVKNMENMSRVSDVLVKAAVMSNASVQQFAESLTNKAGAALRLVNKDIEEGVAVLAVYADQGVKAEEAGEKLNIVFRDLQTAALKNRDTFANLGIQVYDASGKLRNIADVVADLERALGGMSDEQKRATLMMLGFQDRSVAALTALLGTSDAIRTYEKELRSAAGVTEEIAEKQMTSFSAQMGLLWKRLVDVGIQLGQALVPAIQLAGHVVAAIIPAIEVLVKGFTALPAPIQLLAVGLGAVVAAAGPALWIFGQLATSAAALTAAFTAQGIGTQILSAAMGKTVPAGVGAAKAIGLLGSAIGFLANPITLSVAALGLLGYAVYRHATAETEMEKALKANAAAFREKTQQMEAALSTYRELRDKQVLTREETDRLAAATKTLAESSGLSEAAFSREAGAADQLTQSLADQLRARRELYQAALDQRRTEVAEAQAQLESAQKQLEAVLNNQARVRAASGPGREGAGGTREMTAGERVEEVERLNRVIEELKGKLDAAREAYQSMAGTLGKGDILLPGAAPAAEAAKRLGDKLGELDARSKKADEEIAALSATARQQLVEAIKAGTFSLEELQAASDLSELAVKRLKAQVEAVAKETKKAEGPITRFKQAVADLDLQMKAAESEKVPFKEIWEEYGGAIKDVTLKAKVFGEELPAAIQRAMEAGRRLDLGKVLEQQTADMAAALGEIQKAGFDHMKDAAERSQKLFQDNAQAIVAIDRQTAEVRRRLEGDSLENRLAAIQEEMDARRAALDKNASNYKAALASIDALEQASAEEATQAWLEHVRDVEAALPTIANAFRSTLEAIPQLIQSALTGGGGLVGGLKAIGSQLGSSLLGSLFSGGLGQKMTQGVLGMFGMNIAEAFGKLLPGIGSAIGAAIGPLIDSLISAFGKHTEKDIARRVGFEWGVQISEGLRDAIAQDAKNLFRGGEVEAAVYNLADVIDEAGGVTTKSIGKWSTALRDVFVFIERGSMTSEQALESLNATFPKLAAAVEHAGGVASAEFLELIDLAQRFGLESEAIADFLSGQAGKIGGGLAAQVQPAVTKYGDLAEKIAEARKEVEDFDKANEGRELGVEDTQQREDAVARLNKLLAEQKVGAEETAAAYDRIGLAVLASYNAGVAKGLDQPTLMEQLGPALDNLVVLNKNLGLESQNAAVQELINLRAKIDASKELVTAAQTHGEAYAAMINLGVRDTEVLLSMQEGAVANYDALIAAGFTETEALVQMKGSLEAIRDAHTELGIPISENTQALIDQAEEAGVLGEKQVSAEERAALAMERTADVLTAIARKMGVEIPAAADTMAKRIGGAIQKIPSKVPIEVEWEVPDFEIPHGGVTGKGNQPGEIALPEGEVPSFAYGSDGFLDFGAGTLAMLHGREAIVPEGDMVLGGGAIRRPLEITVISRLDGRNVAKNQIKVMPNELALAGY